MGRTNASNNTSLETYQKGLDMMPEHTSALAQSKQREVDSIRRKSEEAIFDEANDTSKGHSPIESMEMVLGRPIQNVGDLRQALNKAFFG